MVAADASSCIPGVSRDRSGCGEPRRTAPARGYRGGVTTAAQATASATGTAGPTPSARPAVTRPTAATARVAATLPMTGAVAAAGKRRAARPRLGDALGLLLAAGTAWLLIGNGWDAVAIVPLAAAAAAAPALARIDATERRLPNVITLPLLGLAAAAGVLRLLGGDPAPLAGLGCGAVLLLMAVVGGMGMGDVKLCAALALATATLGWAVPLAGLAASVVVGGAAGMVALALGRRTVAFGPWLLLGHALAAVVAALRLM